MSEMRDLYQEMILDHYRRPRNRRKPDGANRLARGHNPLCGDRISLYVAIENDRISEIGFDGGGCAISTASASLMTEALKGKTLAEAEKLFGTFHGLLTGPDDEPVDTAALGKLEVLSGVRDFPVRVKCATLAWHTLRAALNDDTAAEITTE